MRRPQCALIPLLALLLALAAPLQAGKRKKAIEFIRPNQSVELPDAAKTFATAARGCANDTWGAAVRTVLKAQDVDLAAKDVSLRLAGGDACLPALPEFDVLRKSVENDYSLDNDRHVRVRLELAVGPPTAADPLAAELQQRRPLIFIYKGHPLLLSGVTYDEHLINNLHKELWITELRLVDPAAAGGSEARTITFKREDPRVADIEGVIRVIATPIVLGQLESR